jgi:hypothetical protein
MNNEHCPILVVYWILNRYLYYVALLDQRLNRIFTNVVVVVFVVFTPEDHSSKPHWIYQSTVQPMHRSLGRLSNSLPLLKLSSLSKELITDTYKSRGTVQMTVDQPQQKWPELTVRELSCKIWFTVQSSIYWPNGMARCLHNV